MVTFHLSGLRYQRTLLKIFAVTIFSVPSPSYSHGGNLDKSGCHNETSTNGYHCHRGNSSPATPDDAPQKYTRSNFGYTPYAPASEIGFYTQESCKTNIDHVVSLKDAYLSGASSWSKEQKLLFANDTRNHVVSCARVNSSKGSSTPKDFLRKSADRKGFDYEIADFCGYLAIYKSVKDRYDLSFTNNDSTLFDDCGITQETR